MILIFRYLWIREQKPNIEMKACRTYWTTTRVFLRLFSWFLVKNWSCQKRENGNRLLRNKTFFSATSSAERYPSPIDKSFNSFHRIQCNVARSWCNIWMIEWNFQFRMYVNIRIFQFQFMCEVCVMWLLVNGPRNFISILDNVRNHPSIWCSYAVADVCDIACDDCEFAFGFVIDRHRGRDW